jgi:hypothetical protein
LGQLQAFADLGSRDTFLLGSKSPLTMMSLGVGEREQAKKKRSKHRDGEGRNQSALEEDELRRKKEERRKKKVIQRFAALGLDEHGEKLDHYSILKYPVREWKVALPGSQEQITFNPIVTLIGMVVLWATTGWISGT